MRALQQLFFNPKWDKLNFFKWRSDRYHGWRSNWPKFFSALALIALTSKVKDWQASGVLRGDWQLGFVLVLIVTGVLVLIQLITDPVTDGKMHKTLCLLFAAAVAFAFLFIVAIMPGSLTQVLYGVAIGVAGVVLVAALTLTTWWPPYGRITRNIAEDK